jgi:hypothetical protein
MIRTLQQVIDWRGKPLVIRCDNGPEYISGTLLQWAAERQTGSYARSSFDDVVERSVAFIIWVRQNLEHRPIPHGDTQQNEDAPLAAASDLELHGEADLGGSQSKHLVRAAARFVFDVYVFRSMEERHRRKSTLLTTNLLYATCQDFLGNRPLTQVLLSRVRECCHAVITDGQCLRAQQG